MRPIGRLKLTSTCTCPADDLHHAGSHPNLDKGKRVCFYEFQLWFIILFNSVAKKIQGDSRLLLVTRNDLKVRNGQIMLLLLVVSSLRATQIRRRSWLLHAVNAQIS